MYESTNILFRSLNDEEEREFADYAKENPPDGGIYNSAIHHPVCCRVWKENGYTDKNEGKPIGIPAN